MDYLVRHPHWLGDFYHVCAKHLEWAKRCVGAGPVRVVRVVTEGNYRTIVSGCVWWDPKKSPTPRNRLALPEGAG